MPSSPSWSSAELPENHSPPLCLQDSSPPPSSWSTSSSEDPAPHSLRMAPARPLPGAHSARAKTRRASLESPDRVASTMTGQELAKIKAIYRVPDSIRLYVPSPDDRVISSRSGRVALYEAFLKAGLRLPFHPLIANILDFYSLSPSQLVPNSVRTLCSFFVLCHTLGLEPRVSLFRSFYILRQQSGWWVFQPRPHRSLKLSLPTSIKGWKEKFFFADIRGGRSSWGDPNVEPNKNRLIVPGDREAVGLLQTSVIPRYSLLLSEENLQLAGLLPGGGEQP